jgi:chromosome transmission fidelity protein 18
MESQSVFGDRKPFLTIIDEIDGAIGGSGDSSLVKALCDMAASINKSGNQDKQKKKTRSNIKLIRPIICICNDLYASKFSVHLLNFYIIVIQLCLITFLKIVLTDNRKYFST